MNEWVSKAKYDDMNAENERLRVMLRLLLGESAGDASQSDSIHRKSSSSIQRRSTVDAISSEPVVNMDMRGGNITDVGRDVHNHVHNAWVMINIDGNMTTILVFFLD